MSAIGSVSAGTAFAVQALPKKSVKDVPEMAFGKVKWEKYFGDIGIEPSLPPNIKEILDSPCPFWPDKKVRETHLLVLVPETVNGNPFHLDALEKLIENPKTGQKAKYGYYLDCVKKELGQKVDRSHWVLMTRDVIPGSRNESYADQKVLAEKHAGKNGVAYKMPKALEVVTAILMDRVSTGKRVDGDKPWAYTRCEEEMSESRWPVAIGDLSSGGLYILYGYDSSDGVVACGSLGTWE